MWRSYSKGTQNDNSCYFYFMIEVKLYEREKSSRFLTKINTSAVTNLIDTFAKRSRIFFKKFYKVHCLFKKLSDCISMYFKKHSRWAVTKRCRLSRLTNSSLVYEPKCGGRGVTGSQPMNAAVHRSPNTL